MKSLHRLIKLMILFACFVVILKFFANLFHGTAEDEYSNVDFSKSHEYLKFTTVGIKSFGRFERVTTLLKSIFKYYPGIKVIIVDDGMVDLKSKLPDDLLPQVKVYQMPFDSGLAAGRNRLIREVVTPFFVYCDEDYEFIEATRILDMVQIVDKTAIDIVSGNISDRLDDVGFTLEFEGRDIKKSYRHLWSSHGCIGYDLVNNFFAANVESLRKIKWDPHFKLGEHEEFFFRARSYLNVAACPFIAIQHNSDRTWETVPRDKAEGYYKYRQRAYDYLLDFIIKHNFDRFISHKGFIHQQVPKNLTSQIDKMNSQTTATMIMRISSSEVNLTDLCEVLKDNPFVKEVVILAAGSLEKPVCLNWNTKLSIELINEPKSSDFLLMLQRCSSAANEACIAYLDLKAHQIKVLKQLYLSYVDEPDRIHWCTNTIGYVNSKQWIFQGASLVASHGCGLMFSKKEAGMFLNKVNNLELKDSALVSFSLSFNRIHTPIVLNIVSSDIVGNYKNGLHGKTIDVITSIKQALGNFKSKNPTSDETTHKVTYLKNVNKDGHIFSTTLLSSNDGHKGQEINEVKLPDGFLKVNNDLSDQSFINAIDSEKSTFWTSLQPAERGDEIGIDISSFDFLSSVIICSNHIHENLEIFSSLDGNHWTLITSRFEFQHQIQVLLQQRFHYLVLDLIDPDQSIPFRFLKLVITTGSGKLLKIQEIQVLAKNHVTTR